MSKIFFTSDHHFGHANIIKFSNRPFTHVEEMNEVLIEKWNKKVGKKDQVYHLGDIGLTNPKNLEKILEKLNGRIYLIKGNHEKSGEACKERFEWIKDYYELTVQDTDFERGKQLLVLFHYGLRVWNASHHGTYHLYGHSHGTLPDNPNSLSLDIGVDCHNFCPLSYDEVKVIMKTKKWKPPFKTRKNNVI
ncbi:metallophosphoesterase family protein [Aquimarina sp. AU119]|uniref:metallophosphoesterase family protein n=1 Tax=Aquimarina sp. AU119 TaxID=2108528 RepID=UPI000D68C74D|nr:metallophosphoesterase family protein [Aquimarina sp. AU119]